MNLELRPSFTKSPENTSYLTAVQSFTTIQLSCWRSWEFQQPARAKPSPLSIYASLHSFTIICTTLLAHYVLKTFSDLLHFLPGPPWPSILPSPHLSSFHPFPLINAAPLRHNPCRFTRAWSDFIVHPEAAAMHSLQ